MSSASRTSGGLNVHRWKLTHRLTERDKVKMSECFRLGDIVKAKVVSISCMDYGQDGSVFVVWTGVAMDSENTVILSHCQIAP